MHPSPLMRTVDIRFPLPQHFFSVVRSVRAFAAHRQLEARRHPSCRAHDPIPPITLIEFRAFACTVFRTIAVEHDDGLSDCLSPIGRKFTHRQHGGETRAAVGPPVDKVAPSVVIPKRCSVDIAFTTDDTDGFLPFPLRVLCFHHIHAEVRVTPIDVIPSVMIADRRRPHPVAVTWCAKMLHHLFVAFIEFGQRITDDFPVDQIFRVEDRQSWHTLERGCCEVIVITGSPDTHIRVAVVCIDDWVGVGAVAIVGTPHLRFVLRHHSHRKSHDNG